MVIADTTVRDRVLSFMARAAAFQKARAEEPDFEALLRCIDRLGRIDLPDLSASRLSERHFATVAQLVTRAVFGLRREQASEVCDLYETGMNSALERQTSDRQCKASSLPDAAYAERIRALGARHGARIRSARAAIVPLHLRHSELRRYWHDIFSETEPAGEDARTDRTDRQGRSGPMPRPPGSDDPRPTAPYPSTSQ